jgi:hypothetical protein
MLRAALTSASIYGRTRVKATLEQYDFAAIASPLWEACSPFARLFSMTRFTVCERRASESTATVDGNSQCALRNAQTHKRTNAQTRNAQRGSRDALYLI